MSRHSSQIFKKKRETRHFFIKMILVPSVFCYFKSKLPEKSENIVKL